MTSPRRRPPRPTPAPGAPRPLPWITRPWVWLLLLAVLFCVPLIKSLGARYPEPLPGWDGPPLQLRLEDVDGRAVSLADLGGHLLVLTELPLANEEARDFAFYGIRRLRKRLRGLGSSVLFVVAAHGGTREQLVALLEERTARKPVNVFLWDEDRAGMDAVRQQSGALSADYLLLDRHARVRGMYAGPRVHPGMDEAQRVAARDALEGVFDELAVHAGQLANWEGSDPEPGMPVTK